ncbi:MAG: hypothetical protein ACTSU2_01120 [Promethearchaeota archaeon]
MSFITISLPKRNFKKELNIISLQQVVGRHVVFEKLEYIRDKFKQMQKEYPEKYQLFNEKIFKVLSPNKSDITYTRTGKSFWTLIIGRKGFKKNIPLLLIGNRIWGIELDLGMKIKYQAEKLGNKRLSEFLKKELYSMLNFPEKWDLVEMYYTDHV